jgi:ketosteroid isomerase-like protein
LKGIDAYRKSWLSFFNWIRNSGAFDLSEVTVTTGDDVAFATTLISLSRDGYERKESGDQRPLNDWTTQD